MREKEKRKDYFFGEENEGKKKRGKEGGMSFPRGRKEKARPDHVKVT